MTARDTYTATVKTAEITKTAALIANESTKQTTIDASRTVVGYTLQSGNYTNLLAAVKSANSAKVVADQLAEHNKQVARDVARDTLRAANDFGPA